jgi:hypothetical protein
MGGIRRVAEESAVSEEDRQMVGVVYQVQPQPWDAEVTRWVDGGAVRIGVEWRDVDPEALLATYGAGSDDMAEIDARSPEGGFHDRGVSFHVCAALDGHEYLRFDAFDDEPHYHYVAPSGDSNRVVTFDAAADGDMLPWVLERLRTRLADMLRAAGGEAVAAAVATDQAALAAAVDEVERLAAVARGR